MDTTSKASKKVLIITYYWPPAGGPGVQRVLKFVKYLPEFGWEPVVLTVKNGEYPATDESLLKDIPPDIKVYKTHSLEPFHLYKMLRGQTKDSKIDSQILKNKRPGFASRFFKWIRFNIFIPDARVGWFPFAVRKGKKILQKENIDVIFSSSPPHSTQLIGKRLVSTSKKPWVADFRDPWSSIGYYQDEQRTAISQNIDNRMEREVLQSADKVITISNAIGQALNTIRQKTDTEVIYNGYDAADFPPPVLPDNQEKLTITYAGFLSDPRIPHILLKVLAEEPVQSSRKMEIHLYGKTSAGFKETVKKFGLQSMVVHHGYIDHANLVKRLSKSDALLMVVDQLPGNEGILTGKLFDYMGARRPIIGIGPEGGEVEKIINDSSSGWYIHYDDKEGMKACLNELAEGQLDFQYNTTAYERKNLTGQLAKVLTDVLNNA